MGSLSGGDEDGGKILRMSWLKSVSSYPNVNLALARVPSLDSDADVDDQDDTRSFRRSD